MPMEPKANEMMTLKVIAETLNRSNDLKQVLQLVLEKLLEVTELKTGWMFLVGTEPQYTFVADHNLPPALSWENKKPMCSGSCFCLSKFWDGTLNQAVNIINCKRIEDAMRYDWGDTCGITHHATVPISAGGELFGILNVASPDKRHFSEDELNLLQSVAYQIGTAVKRTKLFLTQQKRADAFSKLDEVSRTIWEALTIEELPEKSLPKLHQVFGWKNIGFFLKEEHGLILRGWSDLDEYQKKYIVYPHELLNKVNTNIKNYFQLPNDIKQLDYHHRDAIISIPLNAGEDCIGILIASYPHSEPDEPITEEITKALADHFSLAIENMRLYDKQQELKILEERNRLARDLHDSVNQKLFSLSLTAKGAASFVNKDEEVLLEALSDIQKLSQEALTEMRSLIWQLRPAGLEDGIASAIKKYAKDLGLSLSIHVSGFIDLPKTHQEVLWRISQEAMNNVRKHAQVDEVMVNLKMDKEGIELLIQDCGLGFDKVEKLHGALRTLGMTSMRERAEMLGGTLDIESQEGKGTSVKLFLPLKKK